jgi:hypothetical protein
MRRLCLFKASVEEKFTNLIVGDFLFFYKTFLHNSEQTSTLSSIIFHDFSRLYIILKTQHISKENTTERSPTRYLDEIKKNECAQ